jgi:ATP synthase protein I
MNYFFKGSEFLSPIGVGLFIGHMIDKHFQTAPWFMVGLCVVGFCAGVKNIMRMKS